MTTEQPGSRLTGDVPSPRPPDALSAAEAEERADREEDRLRQQVLDDGELGGES